MTNPAPFDPAKVSIERHRFSTTQGEVTVSYDGQKIERYGDNIAMRGPSKDYRGQSDEYWQGVARREAIARGMASDPVVISLKPTWQGLMPALIAMLESGTEEGKQIAREELLKLARDVDALNAGKEA